MNNKSKNRKISTKYRWDAIVLALFFFIETISPAFAIGKTFINRSSFKNTSDLTHSEIELDIVSTKLNNKVKNNEAIEIDKKKALESVKEKQRETGKEFDSKKVALIKPGGPDQPEVQSFTPVGVDNMVDPFTGNFSYNIPLLEIDGYPINLAYNAGVGMEQEATWVGLGWNVNPGVINRNMRGIPDDFKGDKIKQAFNRKPTKSFGITVGANYEIFAINLLKGAINASLSVQHNNYEGFSSSFSIGPSFSIDRDVGLNVGLQYTGSSKGGATVGMNASINTKFGDGYKGNVGGAGSFNSRNGLQELSINSTLTKEAIQGKKSSRFGGGVESNPLSKGATFNFGMSTFVPSIKYDTETQSITGRVKFGGDAVGNDISAFTSGFYTSSKLARNKKSVPSYGYSYLQNGYYNGRAMLDFNRENDGPFTKNTPALPIPHLTYDIYSVSGQGVSGSYRLDRKDIGYVFDPIVYTSSTSISIGGEVNLGGTAKGGVDIGAVNTFGYSMAWRDNNVVSKHLKYKSKKNYFREANELSFDNSNVQFQKIGGGDPAYFRLSNYNTLSNVIAREITLDHGYTKRDFTDNSKSLSYKRNQPLTSLSIKQVKNGFGNTPLPTNSYANQTSGNNHHIGAFTVTKKDGSRYYYGLPAYSKIQKNVSFAVGEGENSALSPDWDKKTVEYPASAASIYNQYGLDNHYFSQTVPKYVHSYMLTSVLSPNYIDNDDVKGPSLGDLGNYVLFKYKQIENYSWRNPVGLRTATYDRGFNTDVTDDKANYIYGEKELWYLDTIETKNHVVVFYTSPREDGHSVIDEAGGLNNNSSLAMQRLDSIKLFSRPDLEENGNAAIAVKVVHFRYEYTLCNHYSGNSTNKGKLTLKKVYFTYKDSYKGERTPYEFEYGFNPDYDPNSVDRWGTYMKNSSGSTGDEILDPLTNSEFPYVGTDTVKSNLWASAWNLSTIKLPSGGRIEVDYEADTYAYVQHKKATQMFKICKVGNNGTGPKLIISDDGNENPKIYFEMLPNTTYHDYASKGDIIYFKALLNMNINASHFDYVPGYAKIEEIGSEGNLGYLILKPGELKKTKGAIYNPITITGTQFARNYLSRIIPPSNQENPAEQSDALLDVFLSLVGAFSSFGEFFTGPNGFLYEHNIGKILIKDKSWIRLKNPNYVKLGGGHRVKEIRTYDSWDALVPGEEESFYGKQYVYHFEGRSSGVASYEPQMGGDENVWRTPVANDISMTWAPDIRNYMETPFGEQVFPTPSVGYSKVLIRNIERDGVTKTATGKTIKTFYTAKDFPTIARRSDVQTKSQRYNLNLLLYSRTRDYMAASQGFVVENNDMHGKPEAVKIYAEGQDAPNSSVTYFYQYEGKTIDGIPAKHLTNDVTLLFSSGETKPAIVGRTYEAVADFRENISEMKSGNIGVNLNFTLPFILVPMVLGSNFSSSNTEFRSAVFAKTIERKGILYKTVAKDYKSTIETENLVYDSETGEVLLTSVNNDYEDTVYNFTYPAHWIYDRMGQAYKNLGYVSAANHTLVDGYTSSLNNTHIFEGDEVIVKKGGNYMRGWVTESNANGVRILEKNGNPIVGSISYLKVIRSGNRNLQATPVGSITLMKNPLNSLTGNVFDEVINAQSIEYGQAWKAYCECNDSLNGNPYTTGRKGNWNPKATYLHLSGRTQTFENENTNLRKDGLMESYTPMFQLENGKWKLDKENWTFTSEVTEFNPNGQALETIDALDRYSSTLIGYNQTLPIASAANAMHKEIGFDGFEDYMYGSCPDDHFKIGVENNLSEAYAHTGKFSIKVTAGAPVTFQKQIKEKCDTINPCDFSNYFHIDPITGNTVIKIGGSDDIIFDYDIIYGSPEKLMDENQGNEIKISFVSSNAFKVVVKLTNPQEGCSESFPIEEE